MISHLARRFFINHNVLGNTHVAYPINCLSYSLQPTGLNWQAIVHKIQPRPTYQINGIEIHEPPYGPCGQPGGGKQSLS